VPGAKTRSTTTGAGTAGPGRSRWAGRQTAARDRITVRGRTKTEVKDKLRTKHQELAAGIRTPANYTVEQCLKEWLQTLNKHAETTRTGYRIMVRHIVERIGTVKLAGLKIRDVDFALGKLAKRLSTRSVRLARMILIQAIRNAMVNDLVVRNVADLAAVPIGQPGRPSGSLNLEQALAVLDAAKGERLWPYVAVSMLGVGHASTPKPSSGTGISKAKAGPLACHVYRWDNNAYEQRK
jgi:hypothetical protein